MHNYSYGGQAVIEGIMMRGKHVWAIAVRTADDRITIKEGAVKSLGQKFPLLTKPVFRGFAALVEMLVFGLGSLTYSANELAEEEEQEITVSELVFTVGLSLGLSIGLFVMLPAYMIRGLQEVVASNLGLNLLEGGIKVALFIVYILIISRMRDIQRVFEYHGAEHKSINCYEAHDPLTIQNVQRHSLVHARCGTSFILVVLLMSVLVFTLFGRPPFLQRVALHIAMLPLVAGLSYEVIRHAGRPGCHPVFSLVVLPGMALQCLTTRQPDDKQVAVAIEALELVVAKDMTHEDEQKVKPFPVMAARKEQRRC